MYWQVYLHKTVVSAEKLLINILQRAKETIRKDDNLFSTPSLNKFLKGNFSIEDFRSDKTLLDHFAALDDSDISASVKVWSQNSDRILSDLCMRIMNRRLFKIVLHDEPFDEEFLEIKKKAISNQLSISDEDTKYYFFNGIISNNAYNSESDKINILYKDGTVCDIADAADTLNIKSLSKPVEKYYICYPAK